MVTLECNLIFVRHFIYTYRYIKIENNFGKLFPNLSLLGYYAIAQIMFNLFSFSRNIITENHVLYFM